MISGPKIVSKVAPKWYPVKSRKCCISVDYFPHNEKNIVLFICFLLKTRFFLRLLRFSSFSKNEQYFDLSQLCSVVRHESYDGCSVRLHMSWTRQRWIASTGYNEGWLAPTLVLVFYGSKERVDRWLMYILFYFDSQRSSVKISLVPVTLCDIFYRGDVAPEDYDRNTYH